MTLSNVDTMKPRLMVVDDDPFICKYIEDVALGEGFEVHCLIDAEDFLAEFGEFKPTVVLLDLMLPRRDGVEILHELGRRATDLAVVLMSGLDARNLEAAERVGMEHDLRMCGALEKPFTPKLLRGALRRVQESQLDEAELRRALHAGEIVPHYQPKVDLASERVVGAEVLARWNHPVLGQLPPRLFIPLAEHSGLITQLTETVSREALNNLSMWQKGGHPDFHIAVNISARELRRRDLHERWAKLLMESQVPPSSVTLEITESEAMWSTVSTTEILTHMRVQGLNLAIDDFGTGFSSLVLLHKLPFSEIKIDRSFIREARTNRDAFVITRSIVELGHGLSLKVTAEGIEDRETLETLRELGCDTGQGFYFARPMSARDLTSWLATGHPAPRDPETTLT